MNFDGMTPREAALAIIKSHEDDVSLTNDDLANQITTACQHFSNEALERGRRYNHQALVAEFFRKMGQRVGDEPCFPPKVVMDLRVRLIAEELCEFLRDAGYGVDLDVSRMIREGRCEKIYRNLTPAFGRNLPNCADALIDLEYVILGTHLAFGVESQPLFEEVHAANMRKEPLDIKNADAAKTAGTKVRKPEGWTGPDIEGRLREQGWKSD